jgi:hypothetical protein
VFTVVTERFNPIERPADFRLVLERLSAFEGPRGVLDPDAEDALSAP